MKCEECLPFMYEYIDGELDQKTVDLLNAHTATCASCAALYEELRQEEEIYARYQRDVEITPALWNIVRARIAEEKIASTHAVAHTPRRRRFANVFAFARFNPALAAMLALVIVGISIGLFKYLRSHKDANRNSITVKRDGTTINPPLTGNRAIPDIPVKRGSSKGRDESKERMIADKRSTRLAGRREEIRRPRLSEPPPQVMVPISADDDDDLPQIASLETDDVETARHIEQVQMLLRSFRNSRLMEGAHALDVSYEKQRSRELLNRNILLRRDAEIAGDVPARELLDSLEPYLLDIANLRDKPSQSDVRSIKERMRKQQIVAALHVR